MASNINIVISAEDKASKPIRALSSELDTTSTKADRFKESLGRIRDVALGVYLPQLAGQILQVGKSAITSAGDYEQSLNIFRSVSGATATEMDRVSDAARALGNDLTLPGVSSKDAAGAMVELSKAGLSVNDTLAASKGVLALARAGQLDTAEAAEIAANALNAFNLEGTQATRVADLLAAAANASSADVQDLAYGLQMSSASAAAARVPLEDLTTLLAAMSNNGIKGSDAGTSLKTMFSSLTPSTEAARKAMRALNLDFYDAQGNFVGVREMVRQLSASTRELTDEQRSLAVETIFGSDASRAANVLIKEGVQGYDSLSKAVNRSGAASELAAAQNAGFNGAMDALGSSLETVGIKLGSRVLPGLTAVATYVASNVEPAFDALMTGIDNTTNFIGAFPGAVTAALKGVGQDAGKWIGDRFNEASAAVSSAIGHIRDTAADTFNSIGGWSKENETAIKVVATVLGVVFGPALIRASVLAAVSGIKIAASGIAAGAGWTAGSVAAGAAWVAQGARIVASSALTSAKMIAHAIAAGVAYSVQAVRASVAWSIEMGKTVALSALSSAKMAVHAADVGWAWVFNGARVSFAWVTQELPKIVASSTATAVAASRQAIVVSAAWVAGAARTSFAWVTVELPKIVGSFLVTSGAATTHALAASAAWIGAASKSAVAWVVTELPRIIGAFVAMASAAGIQAGLASGAWITSAVASSAAIKGLAALVATPMVMPALAIGAALGSIALVVEAVNSVQRAMDALNNAKSAKAMSDAAGEELRKVADRKYAAGQIDKAERDRLYKVSRLAVGTNAAQGGVAWVGEHGPEPVYMPQGAQVTPAYRARSEGAPASRGATIEQLIVHNHYPNDQARLIRDIGFALELAS